VTKPYGCCYAAQVTGEKSEPADAETTADGVLDLLGLMAYAQLVAFFELTDDAASAVSLADKAALAQMAVGEFGHFQLLRTRMTDLHADPEAVMAPFVAAVDAFHARTAPSDWLESLIKAYVGDGIAADFYEAVAKLLDAPTQALVLEVLADSGRSAFVIERVRAAIAADPRVAGRLALWARRLVGEASAQAQRVAAEREPLARLLASGPATAPGEPAATQPSRLGDIGRMFARLTDAHAARMAALGLSD
jgi:tRNA-(MS[2]IO[6]A)-hydroxylase (MiaE)-like